MDRHSLRKAAVLVRSLDADSAAVLLSRLSADEARAVRAAIRELGAVEDDERHDVVDALRAGRKDASRDDLGVELELSFASSLPAVPEPTYHAVAAPRDQRPFAWLDEGDLPTLAQRLASEQLTTVALVLSLLPADRAGGLLAELPREIRADALARLAELEDVDPANLELVESDLETWLREHKAAQQRKVSRQATITAILQHAAAPTRSEIASQLRRQGVPFEAPAEAVPPSVVRIPADAYRPPAASRKPSLPEQPLPAALPPRPQVQQEPSPPFAALLALDAPSFAAVMQACGSDVVVKALAGADGAFEQRMRQWLPASLRRELQRRIYQLVHVRIRDIDDAQQQMTRTAVKLAKSGRIAWSAGMAIANAVPQ